MAWLTHTIGRIGVRKALFVFLVAFVLTACSQGQTSLPSPTAPLPTATPSKWELVWSDEFDGSELNSENWVVETGAGGWGNNELQYYTERPENLRLEDGYLVIEAHQEEYRGSSYTSARIKTQYKQAFAYGRVEARMKLPEGGKGVWPAFWMLGDNFATVGWPSCGEIDIMENIGEPNTIYGTIHGPGYSGGNGIGKPHVTAKALADEFHVYAIEWSPDEISWYMDDEQFLTVDRNQVPGEWVYDHPFFILLNLAVGGNWPGMPDETTQFPQKLVVDYVRVYRDTTLVLPQDRGNVHVAAINIVLNQDGDKWFAEANVKVVDQNGQPVEGVRVRGGWSGVTADATIDGVTGSDGVAGPFLGRKVSSAQEVSFCVIKLSHAEYEYDKSANVQSCAFATP